MLAAGIMAFAVAACGPSDGAQVAQAANVGALPGHAAPAPGDTSSARMDRSRIDGSDHARLWFVIVSDFQCPYCRQFHDQSFDTIRREYVATGKIRIAYVNFPLPMHQNAWPAAEAAMCAGVQGKFWPMQDALFSSQDAWAERHPAAPAIDSIARAIGVDTAALDQCVTHHEAHALIEADQQRAERAGVTATPTIIVGQTLIPGAQPIANYRHIIDSALAATR
jgi:protein-disulfide isomerase